MSKSVYLAGPIGGLSYDDATDWRLAARRELEPCGIECYDPMRFKGFLETEAELKSEEGFHDHPLALSSGILARDHRDCTTANVLFCNFLPNGENNVRSIGTAMEIAWAWHERKPIVLVSRPDDVNRKHPMIAGAISYHVVSFDQGLRLVKAILCSEKR